MNKTAVTRVLDEFMFFCLGPCGGGDDIGQVSKGAKFGQRSRD